MCPAALVQVLLEDGQELCEDFGSCAWRALREELYKTSPFHKALRPQASRKAEGRRAIVSFRGSRVRWLARRRCWLPSASLALS